ncbi:MAG: glycosyltransferase [Flavobacteriales bacterium]|nr:glycosyltransferase [Flavobacteriales bacterium]
MPEFSIITPVLNQASTIEKCIESVAAQNVDVEHIIIDGGSTDGTVDLIRKHEDKLAFWVSEPDRGQSHAINKGLNRAKGTWLNWLNADDQLTENALQTVLKTARPDTQVVVGKCRHINQKGETLAEGPAPLWRTVEGNLGKYSMGQPSHFYRTQVVRKLGGINESLHYCMDMELWFRYLIRNGLKHVSETDDVLSLFLVRPDSKTQQRENTELETYQVYKALFRNYPMPEVIAQFFETIPDRSEIKFEPSQRLDSQALNAHFSWHLFLKAYDEKKMDSATALFEIARNSGRLSVKDKLLWQAKLTLKH